jgi:hypothetical protein
LIVWSFDFDFFASCNGAGLRANVVNRSHSE